MNEEQISQLIKQNPEINYESLKKQATEAGMNEADFERLKGRVKSASVNENPIEKEDSATSTNIDNKINSCSINYKAALFFAFTSYISFVFLFLLNHYANLLFNSNIKNIPLLLTTLISSVLLGPVLVKKSNNKLSVLIGVLFLNVFFLLGGIVMTLVDKDFASSGLILYAYILILVTHVTVPTIILAYIFLTITKWLQHTFNSPGKYYKISSVLLIANVVGLIIGWLSFDADILFLVSTIGGIIALTGIVTSIMAKTCENRGSYMAIFHMLVGGAALLSIFATLLAGISS